MSKSYNPIFSKRADNNDEEPVEPSVLENDSMSEKNNSDEIYSNILNAIETSFINIFEVSNINTTLKYLRENNFWIYGFEAKSEKKFGKYWI